MHALIKRAFWSAHNTQLKTKVLNMPAKVLIAIRQHLLLKKFIITEVLSTKINALFCSSSSSLRVLRKPKNVLNLKI